jgi:2-haloacid dehalogenase
MNVSSARPLDRRGFIQSTSSLVAAALIPDSRATRPANRIRAVAFDGFAIFDATAVIGIADTIIPGKGRDLVTAWRTQLFQYQWLRTLGGRYVDFEHTAADSLDFAVKALKLSLTQDEHDRLLAAHLSLTPWPDAHQSIAELRDAGLRLAFLSNMSNQMLDGGARRAGFREQFDAVLSTDRVRAAKPDPRAYQLAVDEFRLPKNEIAFVAFAGWDAAGASWFGYPTIWTNRGAAPADHLDASPTLVCSTLSEVVGYVKQSG